MPITVTVPSAGGGGGGGANTDGSNIVSPATWRTNLGVASIAETRRLGFAAGHPGVCFDGINGTRVLAPLPAAPGTGDLSLWVRFVVPSAAPTAAVNLIAITLSAGYSNATGSAHAFIGTSGQLGFASTDGTDTVSGSSAGFIAAYAGTVADVVLTRKGTAWELYINGASATSATSTPAPVDITNAFLMVGGNYDAGTITFNSTVQRATYFNRTLSAADVAALVMDGIHPTDQWAATSAIYTSNYASTADGWHSNAETVTANSTDPAAVTQTLRIERTSGTAGTTAIVRDTAALVANKRYRASAYVYNQNIGTSVWMFGSNTFAAVAGTSTSNVPSGSGGTVSGEFIARFANDFRLGPATAIDALPTSFLVSTGGIWFAKTVAFVPCGAMVDLDFTLGIGGYFPDRSPNIAHGEGAGGITHIEPVEYGLMTVTKVFSHADISTTTGTTKIFDLPAKCAITRVELNRTVAMDASITIGVGNSGNSNYWVGPVATSATGFILTNSGVLTAISETASTAVFIRKSASTTVGSVIVRVIYEIRG